MDPEQAITLVEYNAWANHRVLIKAMNLPSALGLSPGDSDFIKFVAKTKH